MLESLLEETSAQERRVYDVYDVYDVYVYDDLDDLDVYDDLDVGESLSAEERQRRCQALCSQLSHPDRHHHHRRGQHCDHQRRGHCASLKGE